MEVQVRYGLTLMLHGGKSKRKETWRQKKKKTFQKRKKKKTLLSQASGENGCNRRFRHWATKSDILTWDMGLGYGTHHGGTIRDWAGRRAPVDGNPEHT